MKTLYRTLGLAVASALLAACATNGTATIPGTTQANLNSNTLQFAVGTATIGQDNTVGVNFVATLRQPNGLSGVLADTPTLTGPGGFLVPANAAGAYSGAGPNVDAGTAHMSGSVQVPLNNAGLTNSTFGTFTGVFSYGFGPFNSDQSITSGAYYPGNPNNSGGNGFTSSNYGCSGNYNPNTGGCIGTGMVAVAAQSGDPTQPVPFLSADPMDYLVGPPAVPFFNDGTFPTNFAGYPTGFTPVEIAPIAGTYTLSVNVPAQNASPITYSKTATLASTTPLPAMAAPTFTSDTTGGGNGTVTVPAGVTETMVYIVDVHPNGNGTYSSFYYAVGPIAGTGAQAYTLPDHLGPCSVPSTGCQNGANAGNSITAGDTYFVSAVGYDYPAFEAGPPGNKQQNPAIVGANGQADITMSPVATGTY
ncbi:MAG: hypothetical protein ACYDEK_06015 [Vulcanimicrobiaceae bacterium]